MAVIKKSEAVNAARNAVVLDLGDIARQAELLRRRAEEQAEAIVADAREQRERLVSTGYTEGHVEGSKKGYSEGKVAEIPEYQKRLPPKLVRINLDDYHANYVGKTKAGDQFFLTFPFSPGGSFIALYLFDAFGALKDARIHRAKPTESEDQAFVKSLLDDLGEHRVGNIRVAPFAVEAFGIQFGLIFDPGDDLDDEDEEEEDEVSVWVTVEPGNYMAFYPPWDGEYDT